MMWAISCFVTVYPVRRWDLYRGAHGESQRVEENYFQSARAQRGFVYVKKSRDILRESCELVNQSVEDYLAQDKALTGELKGLVAKRINLSKFLFEQTKRRPAILPVVMEVK